MARAFSPKTQNSQTWGDATLAPGWYGLPLWGLTAIAAPLHEEKRLYSYFRFPDLYDPHVGCNHL